MHARKIKRKKWLDARSIKLRDKKRKYGSSKKSLYEDTNLKKGTGKLYNSKAPEEFSIYKNHEETAEFFVCILNEIKMRNFHENFYFDFSDVKYVSIESIVYIIAILRNIKKKAYLHYEFRGNFPNDMGARQVFAESGFLKYVEAKKMKVPKSTDNVQIITGDMVDTKHAKAICDFAERVVGLSKIQGRTLYNILIELMSNTVQHAYNYERVLDSYLEPAWFLYCEFKNDKLVYTFVDIGDGIPQTIHKKFLKDIILNDSGAILSALNGEFRSETKKMYRGRGLPYLKSCVSDGIIESFNVMSGKGSCLYNKNERRFIKNEYKKSIFGTVYYWEMERGA